MPQDHCVAPPEYLVPCEAARLADPPRRFGDHDQRRQKGSAPFGMSWSGLPAARWELAWLWEHHVSRSAWDTDARRHPGEGRMKGATDKAIYRDAGGADEQLDKHSLSATAWGRQRHSVTGC